MPKDADRQQPLGLAHSPSWFDERRTRPCRKVGPSLPQFVVVDFRIQGRALLGRPSDVGACGTGATAVEEVTEVLWCATAVEARMGIDHPQGARVAVPRGRRGGPACGLSRACLCGDDAHDSMAVHGRQIAAAFW